MSSSYGWGGSGFGAGASTRLCKKRRLSRGLALVGAGAAAAQPASLLSYLLRLLEGPLRGPLLGLW